MMWKRSIQWEMGEVERYLLMTVIRVANEEHLPAYARRANANRTGCGKRWSNRCRQRRSRAGRSTSHDRDWGSAPRDDAEPGSVYLIRVVEGTPAAAAGLETGDRIEEFDGQSFADSESLRTLIHSRLDSGQPEVKILIKRRGHLRTVTLRLASAEDANSARSRKPGP